MTIRNALTIDVEDYFQVSALASAIKPQDWAAVDTGRVEANTQKILELFDKHQHKATFFTLGWIAERYPSLVRDINSAGHEVASHGYSHQLIYNQTKDVFKQETEKSKKLLEDIIGQEVIGYRAASYSITPKSDWALDTLIDAGFKYDSSIFPVKHDRYGMPWANPLLHRITAPSGREIVEFSLTSLDIMGYRLPIAGGGYFRLFPYWFSKWCLQQHQKKTGQPFVFYLHPWEIDPNQPRVDDVSRFSKFRHYNNLDKCEQRLDKLLAAFPFSTMKSVLEQQGLLATP